MLICAELLLANSLDNGHTVNQGNDLQISRAGAALCELAGRGVVIVHADGAIRSVSNGAAGDALPGMALSHFAGRVGRPASKGLDALGKDVLEGTRDRLIEEGVGRIAPTKHFSREWLFVDSVTRSELIGRLCNVLRGTAATIATA